MPNSPTEADVVVVGAGVIGLTSAWRLLQLGLRVVVIDPAPASGASHAAAGLLAPVTELHYGEERLLALNLESARAYPGFVAELQAVTGHDVGYRSCGTLAVAADSDDLAWLEELRRYQVSLGLDVERLTSRECRRREPGLSPGVRGGVFVSGDHQVDPRRLTAALLEACRRLGVRVRRDRVDAVDTRAGTVAGVLLESGAAISAPAVVVAAGAWTSSLGGLPAESLPPVRPVKGQIARLRPRPTGSGSTDHAAPLLDGNVRGLVQGRSVYYAPRSDGELVIGATVEEQGFDTAVTAGGILDLLRDAYALVPGVYELELHEVTAGLRPGTPDNAPVIGAGAIDGLVWATGHFRNGVLLAPVTGAAVAALVGGSGLPDAAAAFGVDRFGPHSRPERAVRAS